MSTRARAASSQAGAIVHAIRDGPAPARAAVSGEAAAFVDLGSSLRKHLLPAIAIVVLASLVLVGTMTRSAVLAVKALLMSAASLSAALGVLVLTFQDGRLTGLLGVDGPQPLEATMPVLLLAVGLGLSTDYGVFLLSRIKEAHDAGADDADAVALGLERTGRLVTAAAVLFCIAIGALATSRIAFIKETGVGIAVAVAVDATVVRAFLVPSLMALLGRRNWWMPTLRRRRQLT